MSRALVALSCLPLFACGGGSVGTGISFSVGAGSDEINPGNALLIASIADRAVARYLDYRELTTALSDYALVYAPSIPSIVSCPSGGQLRVATLASNSFDVTPAGCKTVPGVTLNAGSVGIDRFVRTDAGSSISFHSTPRAVQIAHGGIDTVSGSVDYRFFTTTSGVGLALNNNTSHAGQLNFSRAGKTDQYANLTASASELAGSPVAALSVTISSLEISTPRAPVSKLFVSTPTAVTVSGPEGSTAGSVAAVSSEDGSRVQYDYLSSSSVRLRCWSGEGRLTLDVVKRKTDADLIAARNAAAD